MSRKYNGIALATLEEMWAEKRRRIAELPPDDISPSETEELLSMRREIDKRKDVRNPIVDVNFSEEYLTD